MVKITCALGLVLLLAGCEDFVKVDPPRTDLVSQTVFEDDKTADAAMTDVYLQLSGGSFASGGSSSISLLASYSADEQANYSNNGSYPAFYENNIKADNLTIGSIWSTAYKGVYQSNAILEGVERATGLSADLKIQLEGEAKFIRAYCYFYLTNLFGDVPLLLTTNYVDNSNAARTSSTDIYKQIIQDLADAREALPATYEFTGGERVRATKGAASALLARSYLYMSDWSNAEKEAGNVIADTLYSMQPDLTLVMSKNNPEAILQFQTTFYPDDITVFYVFASPPTPCALRDEFITFFDPTDLRLANWVGSFDSGSETYYFAKKYNSFVMATEYSTLLRLAEQFLIRAEARTQQNKISDAQADLNVIRHRAGLANTSASDKPSLLSAVELERKLELFTEHGHRWLDLKRTGRVDEVIGNVKGSQWSSTDALYPIPQNQLQLDPAMKDQQNPGY
jgi:hypothetical protein